MRPSAQRIAGRPALGVITLQTGGDGVAYAGALMRRAIVAIAGSEPYVLELSPGKALHPTIMEQGRFLFRLGSRQLTHPNTWWIFNHIGIARAQRLVPRPFRRPYAVLLCGVEAWDPLLSADRKATLMGARARIAISELTAHRVRSTHPDIGDIHACPLALLPPVDISSPRDEALLSLVRASSVLIVGRMSRNERYKGHDELLECWGEVLRGVPGAQLIVAGKGDDLERLRGKASELGLDDDVLFPGFLSDGTLEALRKRVAIFAMPSRGEGFGLVYLDAMRAGLPCIAGNGDAGAEVVVNGETGLCVEPSDKAALASAIVRLLSSPALRATYGAAGRQRYRSLFTFEHFCDRLRPILRHAFE